MARVLEYRQPTPRLGRRGPAKIDSLHDHKILRYQAASEGLTYRQYRERLWLLDIPLEQAVENARNGIPTNEYLAIRRAAKKAKIAVGTLIGTAAVATLIGLSNHEAYKIPFIRPSTAEEQLADFFVRYGFQ